MQWRYSQGNDPTGRRRAVRIHPEDGSWYYGGWCDAQPNGLGAYYQEDGTYIQGGEWNNGELSFSMSQEEYEETRKGTD